jgi:hypothetical protein
LNQPEQFAKSANDHRTRTVQGQTQFQNITRNVSHLLSFPGLAAPVDEPMFGEAKSFQTPTTGKAQKVQPNPIGPSLM